MKSPSIRSTLLLRSLVVLGVLSFLPFLCAQSVEEFPLRPIDPALRGDQLPTEQVIYRSFMLDDHGLNRLIRGVTFPTLTVYRPAAQKNNGTAIVVCPGGGYGMVVIDWEGHSIGRFFQKLGYTVVVLKYRLTKPQIVNDELPLSLQDALEAIRYVHRHSSDWAIRRIGVMGASAGGHLAGSTAIFGDAKDNSRPDFVALLYPVVCMAPPYANVGSVHALLGQSASEERIQKYSLERRARPDLPPFFIAHAKDDTIVPIENSRLLAAALHQSNVPATLIEYTKGQHGFGLGHSPNDETSHWKDAFIKWLDTLPAPNGPAPVLPSTP